MFTVWHPPTEIPPVCVLRKALRGPVTLGHVLVLDELQSPVVKGGVVGMSDLAIAVAVCLYEKPREFKVHLGSRFFPFFLSRWGRRCATLDFAKECEVFLHWFAAQCSGPEYEQPPANKKSSQPPLSAPWYVSLFALAVGELGLSVVDAEAMPVKRLRQLTAALAEMQGNAAIRTETTHNFIEQVKEWERERLGVSP